MKYKRGVELEADQYGALYLARAGYDPMEIIGMLSALKDYVAYRSTLNPNAVRYHNLFTSHPKDDKRLHDAVMRSMGQVPLEVVEPVQDYYELIDGVVFADETRAGSVVGSTFYHKPLRFVVAFPEKWDVANNPQDVTGTAPAGSQDAEIVVSILQPSKKKQDPQEYVEETLKRDDVKNGEKREVNGLPAYVGEIEVAAGDAEARMIAIVYKGQSVFLFKGEAGPMGDPEQFKADFNAVVDSFRDITEADLELAKGDSLRIKVVTGRSR